jgi:hypothetical protein
MQITIDLPQDLTRRAAQSNVPLQSLIIQALRQLAQPNSAPSSQWPEAVLSFSGLSDFLAFESFRDELLPPDEPDLF